MTMQDVAKAMRDIDFTMMTTVAADGGLAARPMSNNQDVEYDGDSWFFANEDTELVREIEADPRVGLTLHGNSGLLGKPPMFIASSGTATLIRDKAVFAEHWNKDLDRWFEQGIDTPGLVLIKAHADHLHVWDGEKQAEVST